MRGPDKTHDENPLTRSLVNPSTFVKGFSSNRTGAAYTYRRMTFFDSTLPSSCASWTTTTMTITAAQVTCGSNWR